MPTSNYSPQPDAQEVISLLNERAQDFCCWLFPSGKKNGSYWEIGGLAGHPGDSLRIHVEGEMIGVWADHGAGESMRGGNLISLLMQKEGTTNWGKALVAAKEWLGLDISPQEDRVFREQSRNGGRFETAAPTFAALNVDGPVYRYLTEERKISPFVLTQYRVGEHKTNAEMCFAQFSDNGKAVVFVKYVGVRRRPDGGKVEYSDPKGASPGLWGKHAVGSETDELVITEGELDAVSVAEVGFPAVSVPNGAGNAKWIERDWRWLLQFRSIILCFDPDQAGREGLEKAYPMLVNRLGRHRCRIATMPSGIKDPNEALQQGRLEDLYAALSTARSVDPQPLKSLETYREATRELFFPPDGEIPGIPLPWTSRLRLRPGEFTIWTGFSGHGKSTALMHCVAYLALEHNQRAIMASMEAPPKKSAAILCQQAAGRPIKSEEQFHRVFGRIAEMVWMYDYLGNAPWLDLIETFRYAWRRYGVTQFIIDSLMTCDIDTDDYNQQSRFIGALCEFADESQGHIHVVAHSKKLRDEKEPPGKFDVAGHANLTNRAFNGITIFRNKEKIDALNEAGESKDAKALSEAHRVHDAELVCWKQRETGDEFPLQLWLHRNSLQFWPQASPAGRNYVEND